MPSFAKHARAQLLSWDVAAGRENTFLLARLLQRWKPTSTPSTSCKAPHEPVEGYPRWSRLLTSEDCVDAVCGGVALLANRKQEVSVRWDAGDVSLLKLCWRTSTKPGSGERIRRSWRQTWLERTRLRAEIVFAPWNGGRSPSHLACWLGIMEINDVNE